MMSTSQRRRLVFVQRMVAIALAVALPAEAAARWTPPPPNPLPRCREAIAREGLYYANRLTGRAAQCLRQLQEYGSSGMARDGFRSRFEAPNSACSLMASEHEDLVGRLRWRIASSCRGVSLPDLVQLFAAQLGGCVPESLEGFAGCYAASLDAAQADLLATLEPDACELVAAANMGAAFPASICGDAPACEDPGPSGADGPRYCGGPDAVECPAGFVCDRTDALCALGVSGQCVPAVCGCDGATYASDCARLGAGVVRAHDGACDPPPTECGGGRPPCPDGSFCDYPMFDCGEGSIGTCRTMHAEGCDLCTAFMPGPVCGCNLVTYASDCERREAGVSVFFEGPCS
jgi:hypothetical protein